VSTTREAIRRYISETFFVERFDDGDSFLRSGVVDSTGMMELVAFVEEAWGLKLADGELVPANLDSVDNLVRFVERKRAAAA